MQNEKRKMKNKKRKKRAEPLWRKQPSLDNARKKSKRNSATLNILDVLLNYKKRSLAPIWRPARFFRVRGIISLL